MIFQDKLQKIYFKFLDNCNLLTSIEFINSVGGDISPMLVLTRIQILTYWFNNDLDNDIAMTKSQKIYINNRISFQ